MMAAKREAGGDPGEPKGGSSEIAGFQMLTIVIPCYNERRTLMEVLRRVIEAPLPVAREVILVDDGSTDGTRELIREEIEGKHPGIRCFYHPVNMGKGAAVSTGYRAMRGDMVVVQDADLEYSPEEYRKLIQPIIDGRADVVYGSRFITGESHRVLYYWHSVGNRLLTTLSNMLTNLNLSDMEVCYKVLRREVADKITIEERRFGFEPEITAKIARLNCRIYEVGISYSGRTYEEGKKIGWRDGLRALWCILKYNLRS